MVIKRVESFPIQPPPHTHTQAHLGRWVLVGGGTGCPRQGGGGMGVPRYSGEGPCAQEGEACLCAVCCGWGQRVLGCRERLYTGTPIPYCHHAAGGLGTCQNPDGGARLGQEIWGCSGRGCGGSLADWDGGPWGWGHPRRRE